MTDEDLHHGCKWYTEWLCEDCDPSKCPNYTKKERPVQYSLFD